MLAEIIETWLRRYLADPESRQWLTVAVQDEEALYVQWVTDPRELRELREEVSSLGVMADPATSSSRHDQLVRLGYRAPDAKEFNYWRTFPFPLDIPAIARGSAIIFESVFGIAPDAAYAAMDATGEDRTGIFEVARLRPRPEPPEHQLRQEERTWPEQEAPSEPKPDAGPTDPYDALRKLAALRSDGIITDAEFEQKRTELLRRI